ncbi:hypothetical protein AbraCBS73388_004451 [Aspergillus brasiliensis]|uniref:Uncharacterized protein n=1 Tax=Aspergillus brasiliensis TaxID=319629 RepID=A0A9W5Z0W7_9EURO|nr:hypothetical protein AbraCBS73388_004451 [Aspergillus brasiliensis]
MCFWMDEMEYWVEVTERGPMLYRKREQRADSSTLPPNVHHQGHQPTLQIRDEGYATGDSPQKRVYLVPKSELLELGKEAWLERRRKHEQLKESCRQLKERQERDEEYRRAQCQPRETTSYHHTDEPALRRSAHSARLYGPTADRVEPRMEAVNDYRSQDRYPGRSQWYGSAPNNGINAHPSSTSPMGYHAQARSGGGYW